jgi:hypothetical protein
MESEHSDPERRVGHKGLSFLKAQQPISNPLKCTASLLLFHGPMNACLKVSTLQVSTCDALTDL